MSGAVEHARAVIVGGGIAGLAAARAIVTGADPADGPRGRNGSVSPLLLLEASARLGGRVRSDRLLDGDLLAEAGPDSLVTNKPEGVALCRELGLGEALVAPPAREPAVALVRGGRLVALPEGFAGVAPTRAWPFLRSSLFSPAAKLRILAEPLVRPRRAEEDEALGEMVRRRFGAQAFTRVVEPFFGGLYTADAERLSVALAAPRLAALERRWGSITRGLRAQQGARRGAAAAAPTQLALAGGMETLVDRLASQLPAGSIRLSTSVDGIRRLPDAGRGSRYRVDTGRGPIECDAVLLACPSTVMPAMLSSLSPELAAAAGALRYASCATVDLAYRRSALTRALVGFGFFAGRDQGLPLLACTYASEKFPARAPADLLLLRVFVGGALDEGLLERDDTEIRSLCHQTLVPLLGLDQPPVFERVNRHWQAIPQLEVGYGRTVERVERLAAELEGIFLAGGVLGAYGLPDSIASGRRAGEAVAEHLARAPSVAPAGGP